MRSASALLVLIVAFASAVGAACASSPSEQPFAHDGGGGGASSGGGSGSGGGSPDATVGADGSMAGPDGGGVGPADGSTTDGPISFGGGWQIPDAGTQPPLVGDGGTTVVIGPGAGNGSPGAFGGSNTAAGPQIVYPPDGVLVPPNTFGLEFHFIPGPGQTLFRFTFQAPTTTLVVYTGCTPVNGGCVYAPDPTFWSSLVAYARGTQPVTFSVTGVDGQSPGATGTSATQSIAFADQDMTGGIYYWNTQGVIQRFDYALPDAGVENYLTPPDVGAAFCVGCHVISRQGYRIVAGKDIPSPAPYSVLDVPTKQPLKVNGQPVAGSANFFSFSPDQQHLLTSDGVSVSWLELATGKVHAAVAPSGTMPDWSPDGQHMVYAQPSSPSPFPLPGVSSASIATMHFDGWGWDTPTTLVPFAGQNDYYPTFSPDGQWVLFNRSPSNAESFSNAAPDPDAGTLPDGELWAVSAAGGTPVRLGAASDPGACSWPKWAPVMHDYYGGKIMWLTFSSQRAYGLRLSQWQGTQIWMAAFDPARIASGQDPSFPAFWLPFQDITGGNHIAQWSEAVQRASCTVSSDCPSREMCVRGQCVPG